MQARGRLKQGTIRQASLAIAATGAGAGDTILIQLPEPAIGLAGNSCLLQLVFAQRTLIERRKLLCRYDQGADGGGDRID
jgi:hypothetical protein